jgi:hypothetical protein
MRQIQTFGTFAAGYERQLSASLRITAVRDMSFEFPENS